MSLLNYYSHLLLTNKYSCIIKISFSFLIYILLLITTNTLNIAECTIEHPSSPEEKLSRVSISEFAPAIRSIPAVDLFFNYTDTKLLSKNSIDTLKKLSSILELEIREKEMNLQRLGKTIMDRPSQAALNSFASFIPYDDQTQKLLNWHKEVNEIIKEKQQTK